MLPASLLSTTVTGLVADQEYVLYIQAVNIKGESFRSGIVQQYASAVPSGLVSPTVQVGSRTDSTIGVQWTVPGTSTTTVLGYQVLINEADSNHDPSIVAYDGSVIPNILTATLRGLRSGSGYYIAVRALNRAGWSDMSSPFLVIIAGRLPQPPAQAPALIKSAAASIKFSWVPTTDIGGASKIDAYNIYNGNTLIDTVSPQTLQYTLVSFGAFTLVAGQSYLISISATSAIGEGPRSLDSLFWAIDTPAAPSSLSVVETSRESCTVTWTPVTPPANSLITGYVLMIDDGLGGDFSIAYDGSINPSLQRYTVENLKAMTTYRMLVFAINKAGNGANSTIISCYTATKPGTPGKPKMVTSSPTSI